ncbi:anti-phage dCTP deaminase [Ramlibacter sp.]|uniref:anti-phage dCTP deaminase n=1 Tax=Ramlibacter sp. TaxID=1917967 RepID=UPI003D132FCF
MSVVSPLRRAQPAGPTAQSEIDKTLTAEIVIALCGPMGTPLHAVAETFQKLLREHDFRYTKAEIIRLSQLIREKSSLDAAATTEQLIEAGNDLRRKRGPAVLAQLAIQKITLARAALKTRQAGSQSDFFGEDAGAITPAYSERHCHIIDSIKNVEELRLLRSVYGDMLHVVGVHAPIEQRIHLLGRRNRPEVIQRLIDRDSGEEMDYGQRVRDTFPMADFFLRADTDTHSQLEGHVRRFLDLMLGVRIITPTNAERAMYAAYSAARNSACLSRQVGAAITDCDGRILATGWNDVPKPFGGLYQSDDATSSPDHDHRCWNKDKGKCFNDEEKATMAAAIVGRLVEARVVRESDRGMAEAAVRQDSQLKGLIEFSRAVHAEMHALLNAGRASGERIAGGKMYVTTYPCHSCARHLIAAGIREVLFVEPYRKSLATKLHPDAITESESDLAKVRVMPFDGVAPSRFLKVFSASAQGRKDSATGAMKTPTGLPVTAISMEALETLEALAIKPLESSGNEAHEPNPAA